MVQMIQNKPPRPPVCGHSSERRRIPLLRMGGLADKRDRGGNSNNIV